jgi:predicted transposase/invertase (TIGR01784 family)
MLLGIDPKIDYAFKWLFGNEKRPKSPIHLLNALLSHERQEQVVEIRILNPFSEKMSFDEKLCILDIKAVDQLGRHFNVEMQMVVPESVPQRFLYYWARLYTEQLQKGDDYDLLKPTISMCFVDGVVFPRSPDYHHVFRLVDSEHGITLTDDLAIHLFELPKFNLTAEQLETPLEAWLYFLRYADRLDPDDLPDTLNTEEMKLAVEELKMLTEVDIQKQIYEGRIKVMRDERAKQHAFDRMSEAMLKMQGALAESQGALAESQGALAESQGALADSQGALVDSQGALVESQEKGPLIGQIGLFEKLLDREATTRAALDAMTLAELADLAAQLERELRG